VLKRKLKDFLKRWRHRLGLGTRQILGRAPALSKPVVARSELVGGKLVLSGRILLNHTPQTCDFILRKFREERITQSFPMHLSDRRPQGLREVIGGWLGLVWHDFSVTLDFPWVQMPSSIFGTGIAVNGQVVSLSTEPDALRILSDDEVGQTWCVFIEPSVRVLRIEMYHFGSEVVAGLTALAAHPRRHPLGVVLGEYTNTARDNGRALFEWLRENAPDVQAHYIVEPDNLDDYSTDQPGVLAFGSRAHLEACLDARVCAFTHHRGYVYPSIIRMIDADRYDFTRTIFLQHGITAMKKSVARHYSRKRVNYSAVAVCSQAERLIFRKFFGYGVAQVYATGFPRYDSLFAKGQGATSDPEQVLFFPTWRPGLEKMTTEQVAGHAFFAQWREAMQGVAEMGLRRVLILHPMLFRHQSLFEGHVDEIRKPTDFQDSLVGSACLVTDYSSVSFDALFLEKPVFLFQFDQDEYGLREDAFIDIDTQLPGDASLSVAPFLSKVRAARDKDWRFELQAQRDLYFDACDDQNSARTLSLIRALAITT